MKKTLLLASTALTLLLSCSQAKDTITALESIGCIDTLTRLSNNEDELTCEELNAELDKLERDCREFLTDDSRADIALLRELCEDN